MTRSHYIDLASLESSPCLCLISAGIKAMYHHILQNYFYVFLSSFLSLKGIYCILQMFLVACMYICTSEDNQMLNLPRSVGLDGCEPPCR